MGKIQWEYNGVQSVLWHTQIFSWLSWPNLKSNIYIPTLKTIQYYTYNISMIYSRYVQELSQNY